MDAFKEQDRYIFSYFLSINQPNKLSRNKDKYLIDSVAITRLENVNFI